MADLMEYKCPACGGTMEFDSKTQKMKCPYCDTEMEVGAYQKLLEKQAAKPAEEHAAENWQAGGSGEWQQGEADGMRIYICKSCGGEIMAEETTAAMTCPFCGNRVVMQEQFSGDRRPDYIIPFQLDKKAAKEAYRRHLKGRYFMPSIFKEENHIEEIKGVYVPFWVFDAEAQASATFSGEICRVWKAGDREYTEHENYELYRSGTLNFEHIPTDGSKKMDDALMESIEPFDFSGAVPFQTAYLAGYAAERYDVDAESCIDRARARMRSSALTSLSATVQGFQSVRVTKSSVHVSNATYHYALYPVWILNTKWRGKQYIFAMNGQTGRMVGNLPFDKNEFMKYVATRGVAIGMVMYALLWALMSL
ncbi:MAG: hypothetical protein J6D13_03970 [Clostridium sp.]|nr:hypothetical protein [Clostridium sp.]